MSGQTDIEKGLGRRAYPLFLQWLPFLDTYRTMCLAPEPDFRRLIEEARELPIAA